MNTTNLFVELIVIGSGAAIWLLLVVLSLFGYDWFPWEKVASSTILIVPLISIVYVLGISIDRLADTLYGRWDKQLRKTHGFSDNQQYHDARTYVYTHATDRIVALFEYGRSRLRISRAWSINFSLLAINFPIFIWTQFPQVQISLRLLIIFSSIILFGLGALATLSAWRKLVVNDGSSGSGVKIV